MLHETHLYEERVSGKGLALLCEAVDISSTAVTNLVRDINLPDIDDISRDQMFVGKHLIVCIRAFLRLYECPSIPFFDVHM